MARKNRQKTLLDTEIFVVVFVGGKGGGGGGVSLHDPCATCTD